jgi:aryl-alcohol dehydrogenase-like predicted oxidoreductase
MTAFDRLAPTSPAARLGLGLAAVGRPGYINLGRDRDLPPDRSVAAMRSRAHDLLDEAYARGVRYFDVARSYGRAEEFLGSWLEGVDDPGVVVGSKWGYTYTADWRVDADVHEVKDHSLATFDRQIAETRALLGDRLDVYQVHSVTPDSSVLTDTALQRRLAGLAAEGVTIGISTSGPRQADAIRSAIRATVDGAPLFRSVQTTWNPLEPSAGAALEEASATGCAVIVKEALANGRLAGRPPGAVTEVLAAIGSAHGVGPDAVALAAALHQPWATAVLSGAATVAQLDSNLRAPSPALTSEDLSRLAALAEAPEQYWQQRSAMPWA